MAEQPKKYFQVELDNSSDEQISLTNIDNKFVGKFLSVDSATNNPEDVRSIFVQDIKLNNVVQETTIDNGRKVVNLQVPYSTSRIWVATSLDGTIKPLGGQSQTGQVVPKPGDFLIIKEVIGRGLTKNTPYIYTSYDGIQVTPVQLSQLASVTLTDHDNMQIEGKIDSNGNADIKVDNLNLDKLNSNEIYVNDLSIKDLIKQVTVEKMANVEKLNVEEGVTLDEVAERLNTLIQAVKDAANN